VNEWVQNCISLIWTLPEKHGLFTNNLIMYYTEHIPYLYKTGTLADLKIEEKQILSNNNC